MGERRRLTKDERRAVYEKTDGHCAYCGIAIRQADMQVDHVTPIRLGGRDELANMLPACRSCNLYKSGNSLYGFRNMVEAMPATLARDSVTYRNAVRFGMVKPMPHEVVFYYEQIGITLEDL